MTKAWLWALAASGIFFSAGCEHDDDVQQLPGRIHPTVRNLMRAGTMDLDLRYETEVELWAAWEGEAELELKPPLVGSPDPPLPARIQFSSGFEKMKCLNDEDGTWFYDEGSGSFSATFLSSSGTRFTLAGEMFRRTAFDVVRGEGSWTVEPGPGCENNFPGGLAGVWTGTEQTMQGIVQNFVIDARTGRTVLTEEIRISR